MTKTFKEYRESKKNKPEIMETVFGSHSQPKTETMTTSFGSHSKPKNVNEDKEGFELEKKPKDAPAYAKHKLTPEQDDHIHTKVAPLHADKISDMEKEAVHDYSDESRPLNSMLHRHAKGMDISTKNSESYKKTVKHLDNALGRHKTTEDMHVYTGLQYSPSKHFKKVDGKVPERQNVSLPSFVSTSSSVKSARAFSQDTMHPNDERHGIEHEEGGEARHVLKIHVPKGSHAMSLRDHSFVPEEKEVLLHRGHDIEIHHKPEKLDHSTYLWHAKIVAHNVTDLDREKE